MAKENTAVKSYVANITQSLLHAGKIVVKDAMPTMSSTVDKNQQLVKSGLTYTREFLSHKGPASGGSNKLLTNVMKDVDAIKKNAFERLKSGKLTDFDKQTDDLDDLLNMGGEFAIDWGDSNGDPFADPNEPWLNDDTMASIKAVRSAAKIQHDGDNIRTKVMVDSIYQSAEQAANYTAKTATKLQTIKMNMAAQMHTETVKLMGNTNALLQNMVSFNNNQVVEQMNRQTDFYQAVILELQEIKASVKMPEKQQRGLETSAVDEVFGSGGLDLAAYAKQIKGNFMNSSVGTMLGMGKTGADMMGGSVMDRLKNDPFGVVISMLGAGLLPKSIGSAMKNLDNSFSGLMSAMVLRLNGMRDNISILGDLSLPNLLGLNIGQKKTFNVGGYHREAMQYNGKADKALTEVIPTLLSHILSTLQGTSSVAHFDYTTGRFRDGAAIIKENNQRVKDAKRSPLLDVKSSMRRSLRALPGGDSAAMEKDLDTFLEYIVDSGKLYNPRKETSAQEMKNKGLDLSSPDVYNALRAAFLNMPKHLQNTAPRGALEGRGAGDRTMRTIENDLFDTGLSSVYGDLTKVTGPTVKGPGAITPVSLLKDIKNILIDGIIVYGAGNVNDRNPSSPKQILKRRTKNRRANSEEARAELQARIRETEANGPRPELDDITRMPFDDMRTRMASANNPGDDRDRMNSGFLRRLLNERSMVRRAGMIRDKVTNPSQLITGIIGRMDSMIYRMIYGKDDSSGGSDDADGDGGGGGRRGIIGRITDALRRGMDKSIRFIDAKIFTPMHEKFFGEQGLFTKFMESFDPFIDRMKEMGATGFKKVTKFLMGDKNAQGFYTGGALADVGNMFVDFGNATRNLLTGGGYTRSDGTQVGENGQSVFSYVKQYSKALFENIKVGLFGEKKEIIKEDGTVVLQHDGTGLFNGVVDSLKNSMSVFTSMFKTKEGEDPSDVQKTVDKWKGELKGFLPKGIAGGTAGMMASMLLPGGPILGAMLGSTLAFASHSSQFREMLFGNEEAGKDGMIPKKYVDGFKKYFPSMSAGGLLGMVGSVVLPGGPLLGLMLGSSIGYASKSERVQELLFGKEEDGKVIKEGLLGSKFKGNLKKFFPNMGAGGIMGMIGSAFLPGGPLIGLMLGSAAGFASKSEAIKEMLFGKEEDGKVTKKGLFSPATQAKLKKALPVGVLGGLAGVVSGTVGFLSPAGPLLGAMLGATLAIAGTGDKFKDMIFGKYDPEEEKRKGGALGRIRDFMKTELFDPFREWRKKKGLQVQDWFMESVRKPFEAALDPFKQAMGMIGTKFRDSFVELKDSFKGAINRVFEKSVGAPLGELVKKYITDPMKGVLDKLFNAIGKGLAVIATSPIKFMTRVANSVLEKEEDEKKTDKSDKKKKSFRDRFEGAMGSLNGAYIGFLDSMKPAKDKAVKDTKEKAASASNQVRRVATNIKGSLLNLIGRLKFDPKTGDVIVDTEQEGAAHTDQGVRVDAKANSTVPNNAVLPPTAPQPENLATKAIEEAKAESDKNTGLGTGEKPPHSSSGINGLFFDGVVTLSGELDLKKLGSHVETTNKNVQTIRDEVHGQLNGVGWNLQYIANILTDVYGSPSTSPEEMEKRGNKRRKGFFGRMTDMLRNPVKAFGGLLKDLVTAPFKMVTSLTKSLIGGIVGTVKNVIGPILRLPAEIVKITGKVIGTVGRVFATALDMVAPAVKGILTTIGTATTSIMKGAGKLLVGAADGLGRIIAGAGKTVGSAIALVGDFARHTIPKLTSALGRLTGVVGDVVVGIGKFAKDMVLGSIRGVANLFKKIPTLTKSVQQVYVAGGTLDTVKSVTTIKEIHTLERLVNIGPPPIAPGSIMRRVARRQSHASGLDVVPYDNYQANLHRGEMVVPGEQANLLRIAAGESPVPISTTKGLRGIKNQLSNKIGQAVQKSPVLRNFSKFGRMLRRFTSNFIRPMFPRIDYLAKQIERVNTEDGFNQAHIGLLNDIAVSNIQILNAIGAKQKDSLWDMLKGLLTGLGSLLNPLKFLKGFPGSLIDRLRSTFPSLNCPCPTPTGGGGGGGGGGTRTVIVGGATKSGSGTKTTSSDTRGRQTPERGPSTSPTVKPGTKAPSRTVIPGPGRTTPTEPTPIRTVVPGTQETVTPAGPRIVNPSRNTPAEPTPLRPAASASTTLTNAFNDIQARKLMFQPQTLQLAATGTDGAVMYSPLGSNSPVMSAGSNSGNIVQFRGSTSSTGSSYAGGSSSTGGPRVPSNLRVLNPTATVSTAPPITVDSAGRIIRNPQIVPSTPVTVSGTGKINRIAGATEPTVTSSNNVVTFGSKAAKSTTAPITVDGTGRIIINTNAVSSGKVVDFAPRTGGPFINQNAPLTVDSAGRITRTATNVVEFNGAKSGTSTSSSVMKVPNGAAAYAPLIDTATGFSKWLPAIGQAVQYGDALRQVVVAEDKNKAFSGALGTISGGTMGAEIGAAVGGPYAPVTGALGGLLGMFVGKEAMVAMHDKVTKGVDWPKLALNVTHGIQDYIFTPVTDTVSNIGKRLSSLGKAMGDTWDAIAKEGITWGTIKDKMFSATTLFTKITNGISDGATNLWNKITGKEDKEEETTPTWKPLNTPSGNTLTDAITNYMNGSKTETKKAETPAPKSVVFKPVTTTKPQPKITDFLLGGKGGESSEAKQYLLPSSIGNASTLNTYANGTASTIGSLAPAAVINSVPHISQLSTGVKTQKFGKTKDTLGDSGCAPAVAAMALSAIIGRQVTITEMANLAASKGFKVGFNGTNPLFFKYLEKDYPVRVTNVTGQSMSKRVLKALQDGHLVILMGGGQDKTDALTRSTGSSTPFGSVAHYVLATGYDQTKNRITVNDPLSKSGSDTYNLTSTLASSTGAFVIQSRSSGMGAFSLRDMDKFLPGLTMPMLGKGDDTDAGIRSEFGYAIGKGKSDITVDDIRMIKKLGAEYGVNPHLWLALAEVESGWNSKAENSKSSAKGWGQVIKGTGKWLYTDKLKLGSYYDHDTMALDKETNARMSMYYLASNIKSHSGNIDRALIRYNGNELGQEYPNRVSKYLRENSGLTFADVGNVEATGVNTYNGSSDSSTPVDDGKIRSMSDLMTNITSTLTSLTTDRYGIDVTKLLSGVDELFGLVDPLNDGTMSSDSSSSASSSTIAWNPNASSSSDDGKAGEYKNYILSKYTNLKGDTDMHEFLAQRISNLASAYGKSVDVTSGWRSAQEQQRLITEWRQRNPGASDTERRKWVADPGQSKHDIGLAADLAGWIKQVPAAELAKYGLWKPMSNEDWHFEPIETKAIGRDKQEYLRSIFGQPYSPATGYEKYLQAGFGKGGTPKPVLKAVSVGKELPVVGNGIGDPDSNPGAVVNGAPSAAEYAANAQLAASYFMPSSSSRAGGGDDQVVALLKTIIDRLDSLVNISAESKTIFKNLASSLMNGTISQESGSPTVAIIRPSSQTQSTNPMIDGQGRSPSKSSIMAAIAAGTR
jgi:hypothetical protein